MALKLMICVAAWLAVVEAFKSRTLKLAEAKPFWLWLKMVNALVDVVLYKNVPVVLKSGTPKS